MEISQGMNVEAVRGIGRQLAAEASALEGLRARVDALAGQAGQEWRGADAQQFVGLWRSGSRGKIVMLIGQLQELGRKATQNADAQEQTSSTLDGASGSASAGGGGGGGGGGGWDSVPRSGVQTADDVVQRLGEAGTTMDATEFLLNLRPGSTGPVDLGATWGRISTGLGALTLLRDSAQVGYGLASGDSGAVLDGGLDALVGAAGLAGGPMVGIPAVVAKGFVDSTIAYTPEAQESLLDYQTERMYGTSRDNLTPEQASALVARYDGPMGVVNVISDKMDQSGQWIADAGDKFWRWTGLKK